MTDAGAGADADSAETGVVQDRMIAHVLDQLLVPLVAAPVFAVVTTAGLADRGVLYGLVLVLYCGYSAGLEGAWDGRTIGKRFAGVRVAAADGTAVSWPQALVRNVPTLFVFLLGPGLLPYLVGIFETDRVPAVADAVDAAIGVGEPAATMVALFAPGLVLWGVALVAILVDDRHRRLFDVAAGTVVVRDR